MIEMSGDTILVEPWFIYRQPAVAPIIQEQPSVLLRRGDALEAEIFARGMVDVVISTGLGEFLGEAELACLYANVQQALRPGGVFYISATGLEPRSEALLRAMELETNYRDWAALERVFAVAAPRWQSIEIEVDESGLQTFVRASN
ncbi:MAG: SAM-dependent methyltransferase [Verrucomicrobiales bacterium]